MGPNNYVRGGDGDPYIPDGGHAEETLDKFADVFMEPFITGTPLKVLYNGGGHLYVTASGRSRIPGATWWGGGHDTLAGGFMSIQGGGTGSTGWITLWELDWSLEGVIELMATLQCRLGKCDDSNSQGPIKVEKLIKKCIRGFMSGDSGGGVGDPGGEFGYSTMSDFDVEGQGFDRKGARWVSHHEIICCGECNQYNPNIWSGGKLINCKGIETVITPGLPADVRREIGKMMWNCVKKGCPDLFEGEQYTTWEGIDCGFWD